VRHHQSTRVHPRQELQVEVLAYRCSPTTWRTGAWSCNSAIGNAGVQVLLTSQPDTMHVHSHHDIGGTKAVGLQTGVPNTYATDKAQGDGVGGLGQPASSLAPSSPLQAMPTSIVLGCRRVARHNLHSRGTKDDSGSAKAVGMQPDAIFTPVAPRTTSA
jgi:hypothetical protein